jgi:hypothetical protein
LRYRRRDDLSLSLRPYPWIQAVFYTGNSHSCRRALRRTREASGKSVKRGEENVCLIRQRDDA